ncbi:MAG: hypothetical protein M1438_14595 [Deltaproteobacteria bacterium]|nr:hypothetical protein [Deltaproteobacteria bacterium]
MSTLESLELSFFLFETGGMAYTAAQVDQMLSEVQAAISKILTSGEEYQAGGNLSLRRASLAALQKREQWLLGLQAQLAGGNKTLARCGRPQ